MELFYAENSCPVGVVRQRHDTRHRPNDGARSQGETEEQYVTPKCPAENSFRALIKSGESAGFCTFFATHDGGAFDRPGAGDPTIGISLWISRTSHPAVKSFDAGIGTMGTIPGALWLSGDGLLIMLGLRRRMKK
jgi:hypothetical protein